MLRAIFTAGVMLAASLGVPGPVCAQSFPSKPVRLIVPFAPGGPSDTSARAIAEGFQKIAGQPLLVEHRPGAGAIVGTQALLQASADGYTLMMASNVVSTSKWLYEKLPFDTLKDLRAVVGISKTPSFLLVAPSFPANNVSDFIRVAKAQPGKLNYGTSGSGTISHLGTELFMQRTGTNMVHVPYKGSGPVMTALISGEVQVRLDTVLTSQAQVRAGSVKALGVTALARLEQFPDIPTFDEQGLKGFDVSSWFGIVVHAGAPNDIVLRLNEAINRVLETPAVRERLSSIAAFPIGGPAQVFQNIINAEYEVWGKVISAAGIKPN